MGGVKILSKVMNKNKGEFKTNDFRLHWNNYQVNLKPLAYQHNSKT